MTNANAGNEPNDEGLIVEVFSTHQEKIDALVRMMAEAKSNENWDQMVMIAEIICDQVRLSALDALDKEDENGA